jgi:hypothetical protein
MAPRAKPIPPRKERWAFSQSELADPAACKGDDELVAYVDLDDDWDGVEGHSVIVYRNGKVSNRFSDGTAGVPRELAKLADNVESLLHPDGEETAEWRDVRVDDNGNFLRFVESEI